MNHPGLTVAGSLRSALLTCFWDEMEDGLGVRDGEGREVG